MHPTDYWYLCENLTVTQAAHLMVGLLPTSKTGSSSLAIEEQIDFAKRKMNMHIAGTALVNSIICGRLSANIHLKNAEKENHNLDSINSEMVDWNLTTILVKDLREWLKKRGMTTGFFFQKYKETNPELDYLDPDNKYYSKKLAAAVYAWKAVSSNPKLYKGKSVKRALVSWLDKNAKKYGLIKENGKPNKQGINEIAKISNWNVKGGVPKTPG